MREQFQFRIPGYRFVPRYQQGLWDGYIHLYRYDSVPAGLFLSQKALIEQHLPIDFFVTDSRKLPQFRPWPKALYVAARDYQRDCVEAMIKASGTGGLVLNCTGSGKTFIAAAYLSRLIGPGCFLVDELTLLDQARRQIAEWVDGGRIGIIGGGEFAPQRITVATAQTIQRSLVRNERPELRSWLEKQQVIFIDELHLAVNPRMHLILTHAKGLRAAFGLTATLELQKAHIRMPSISMTGPPIYVYPLHKGVTDGVLSDGIALQVHFPIKGGTVGSYSEAYEHYIVRNRARNRCIAALARAAMNDGRRTAILVERRRHLRLLARHLDNIPHRALSGSTERAERTDAIQAMESGSLRLLIVTRIFAKGVDIPHLDCVIDATAAQSKNAVAQRYGRGSRRAKGKRGLLFIDISDSKPSPRSQEFGKLLVQHARSRDRALQRLGIRRMEAVWDSSQTGLEEAKLAGALVQRAVAELNQILERIVEPC